MSDWRQLAACRGRETWWWFSIDPTAVALARRVCSSCPVAEPCLAEALAEEADLPGRFGIRGGLTAGERSSPARIAR